jgi:CubicO group peptidase (beta-lactamase class C family)
MRRRLAGAVAAVACVCAAAGPAHAAKSCPEPAANWERATPAEAGMDAAKLQQAMDYGSANLGFAVRVYRGGCLVAEDRLAAVNRNQQFESYSMAKSVTSLMFGRAMTNKLISPEDPVGSLVPEADGPHGSITMRHLLTMTSGLRWNGFRDYNVFTMPDRVRDALTLEMVHEPGTYYEYAQSAVALLAEAVGRSAGEDAGAFVQRELMDPLGIPAGAWRWSRDPAGHIQGFYGVNMRADDFGRLGELLRRGGMWRGQRLLSARFVREATGATPTNGCYGWLIWVNAAAPCVGPTVSERPVEQGRDFPDLPADMYKFSGLFGQLVTVFPSQELVVVRTGQDPALAFAGGADWEHGLYKRVLDSITDGAVPPPPEPPRVNDERTNPDYGFQTSLREPNQYSKGLVQDPLPPAGPGRARAARLAAGRKTTGRRGIVVVRLACPARWLSETEHVCAGRARLTGARRALRYSVAPGERKALRFRLRRGKLRALRTAGSLTLTARARNRDRAQGTPSWTTFTIARR